VNHLVTVREWEVMECVRTGMTNREIADALFISVRTVQTHISHVMAKLSAANRFKAVIAMDEMGPPPARRRRYRK
jgi:DNA-binding NarL/FixJ family response regulator